MRYDLLLEEIAPAWSQPQTLQINAASAYEYAVAPGQPFAHESILLTDGVRLFLPNPADGGSYLHTDDKGILRYRAPGESAAQEMKWSPFHAGYSAGIESYDGNKHRIVELDWSADGTRFSFRIDTPAGLDNSAAGVWHWQPQAHPVHGATVQLIRDCAHDGYRPCHFVNPSNARHWQTVNVDWSPVAGDTLILLTVRLPEENRNALAMTRAVADIAYANNAPSFSRYDYGHWDLDGQSVTVSGRRPDGRIVIAQVNPDFTGERLILDGAARGLWLRNAARLPTGEVFALGRPGAPGSGPVALYDMQGRRISDFVGDSAPEAVRWHSDRSHVTLGVAGRQYTVRVADGAVYDSSDLAANPQFGRQGSAAVIPDAVIRGSAFYPGQQLRVLARGLNLRESPGASAQIIETLAQGDYVAVFAGPHDADSYRWWRVQTAQNRFGWVVDAVGSRPTLATQ